MADPTHNDLRCTIPSRSILLSCNLRSCIFYLHPLASIQGMASVSFQLTLIVVIGCGRTCPCATCPFAANAIVSFALFFPGFCSPPPAWSVFYGSWSLAFGGSAPVGPKNTQMGWKCLLNIEMSWILVQRYTVRQSNADSRNSIHLVLRDKIES